MDLIGRLVDKSLVQLDEHTDRHGQTEAQYRLLETVRQYALDRARDAGELALLRDAHADWWIAELERIDARQPTWDVLDLLSRHLLDLRAALDWLEPDRPRRCTLLALVALGWSWGGHTDDVLHYVDRWVIVDDVEQSVPWARAFCASTTAMFSSVRAAPAAHRRSLRTGRRRRWTGVPRWHVAGVLGGEPDHAPRRFATAMELAIADDCDVLLASFGGQHGGLPGDGGSRTRLAATPRRSTPPSLAGAAPLDRCVCCDLGEPPNCVPLLATRFPDVELRSDDLFLMDRFLHVVVVLGNALIHGRTDQFDINLGFLARYPHYPGRPALVRWPQRRAQGHRWRRPRRARD